MKKIALAAVAVLVALAPVTAEAGDGKHWKRHGNNHGNQWHGNNHNNWHGKRKNNNWQNGDNNYYHGGNKYYYGGGYGGGYDYFYQDPGFWGGVVGGIVGGAIANDGPAPMAPQCIVQPYKVWDDYQGWVIQYRQICN